MKQIKQETGRSMVEMLGVLAVIGVLSVGGISGYTLAMNKHRANSVAADLMKRAVVISAQRQLGQPDPNMDSLGGKVGEYVIEQTVDTPADGKFAMTVKAVPEEVCKKILALDWDNVSISPDKAEDCNGEDMTFTYNNDLSPVTDSNAGGSTGGEGTDTPQEPTCEGTVCGANCCPAGTTCTEGKCCADDVRDENGENIGCAPEGQDLYCSMTAENGDCSTWATCPKGKESTKDWIVGMSHAYGYCAYNDGDDVYCAQAGPSGCNEYSVCTVDGEVGKNLEAYAKQTGHDVGGEVCCPEGKVYCQVAFLDGTCEHHDCQANYEGELTQGIYGDLDVICPSYATPYISKVEMMDGPRFEGSCCDGTVQPGDAYQGIGDTCIE